MHLARMLPRFRKAYRSLAEYAERETWSRTAIEDYQLGRLNELWQHALRHVDHYRRLAKSEDLPPRFGSLEEFRTRVPVLQKSAVRADRNAFLSERAKPGKWWYTGGSTGRPTPVYRSHDAHQEMLRARYRFYQIWDVDIFDRWTFLWGHGASFAPGLAGWKDRLLRPLSDWLRNRIRCSAYHLGKDDLQRYLKRIAAFQPAVIYAYSMAGYLLAQEAAEVGFQCPSLKMVNLTSEPVHAYIVEAVERAFGVPAVTEYGSIECGFMAGESRERALRVREDVALLETLPREDGTFEIVVTVLGNPCFPLIRYNIGDIADRSLVYPARGFAILGSVTGRNDDLIMTKSGRTLHGTLFEHILDKYHEFRRWRICQQKNGSLQVLIESSERIAHEILGSLEEKFCNLVEGYGVKVEVVRELPGTPSGKHRSVASELARAPSAGSLRTGRVAG
jgi:phenylacetate-CoA ligase